MPVWYLWALTIALFYFGFSVIAFSQITVRRINRKVKDAGEYYLSTEDKVGYTLLNVALAILLPLHIAEKYVPKIIIDAHTIKKIELKPYDYFFSISYMLSMVIFLVIGLWGTKYV